MNLSMWLYLVNVVHNLGFYFTMITVFCFVGLVIAIITAALMVDAGTNEEQWKLWRQFFVPTMCVFIVSSFCSIATPTEKTMYLMLGTKAASDIVNNPTVKDVGGKVLKIINKKLDDFGAEDAPEKK